MFCYFPLLLFLTDGQDDLLFHSCIQPPHKLVQTSLIRAVRTNPQTNKHTICFSVPSSVRLNAARVLLQESDCITSPTFINFNSAVFSHKG